MHHRRLALRLQREAGMRVVNVAVTQGSNKARQAERWDELSAACDYLGFELVETVPGGLERINSRDTVFRDGTLADRGRRDCAVITAAAPGRGVSSRTRPTGTARTSARITCVMDALGRQAAAFDCHVVETEFWGAMATPNLMVESSAQDIGDMMAALSFHVGEVQRQPVSPPGAGVDAGQRAARRRAGRRPGRCGAGFRVLHAVPAAPLARRRASSLTSQGGRQRAGVSQCRGGVTLT